MICSSVCLLRFIVWSFLKARLQFTSDQFNGATSAANVGRLRPSLLLAQHSDDLLFRVSARPHVHPLAGDGLYPFLEAVWGLSSGRPPHHYPSIQPPQESARREFPDDNPGFCSLPKAKSGALVSAGHLRQCRNRTSILLRRLTILLSPLRSDP
jgi:hypothetical protein